MPQNKGYAGPFALTPEPRPLRREGYDTPRPTNGENSAQTGNTSQIPPATALERDILAALHATGKRITLQQLRDEM